MLEAAKWIYEQEPQRRPEAIKLVTEFNAEKLTLEGAIMIYNALLCGAFGDGNTTRIEEILIEFGKRFPYALVFMPPGSIGITKLTDTTAAVNHFNDSDEATNEPTNAQKTQ